MTNIKTIQDTHRKVRKQQIKHNVPHNTFHITTVALFIITLHAVIKKQAHTPTSMIKTQTHTNTTHILTAVQCLKSHHNNTNTHQRHTILLLLLLCGDTGAIVNPGPYCPKYPCVLCTKAVKWGQRAIKCESCDGGSEYAGWYHVGCIGPSHRFMLDWLTIASRGSVTDVVYLISLALSSHLTPFHSLIPSTF